MRIILTNHTADDIYVKLPDGGRVPATSSATFDDISSEILEEALRLGLDTYLDSGALTMDVSPNGVSDAGARVYSHNFTVDFSDFTAVAPSETLEDTVKLPARARLVGYIHTLSAEFSGGAVTAAVVDVGISATETDTLTDATDVFTGAGVGEGFGAGTNAKPTQPQDLGEKSLRVKLTATGDNLNNLAAGSLTMTALYAVL